MENEQKLKAQLFKKEKLEIQGVGEITAPGDVPG